MLKRTERLFAIVILTFVSACGGGSEGGKEEQASSNSNVTVKNITVKTETYNKCGEESAYANADVIFHRDDGKKLLALKTDASGNYHGELPKETKHLTIVGIEHRRTQYADTIDVTKIYSFIDFEEGDIGKISFLDERTAVCTNHNKAVIDLSLIKIEASGYRLRNRDKIFTLSNYTSDSEFLTALRDDISLDATLTTPDGSLTYAALIEQTEYSKYDYSIKLSDFKYQGTLVDSNEPIGATEYSAFGMKHGFKFLENGSRVNSGMPYIFPDLVSKNFFSAKAHKYQEVNGFYMVEIANTINKVLENGSVDDLVLPDFNDNFKDEIFSFVSDFSLNSTAVEYDFSDISDGMNIVQFDIDWDKSYQEPAHWTVRGPLNSSFPMFEIDEFIQSKDSTPFMNVTVALLGFNYTGDLKGFRDKVAVTSQLIDKYESDLYNSFISLTSHFQLNR